MRVIGKLIVFGALLWLVNVVAVAVLESNLRNGVYPINADSIGIPIAETTAISIRGGFLLLALVALSWLCQFLRRTTVPRPWFLLSVSVLVLCECLAVVFFAAWASLWLIPHHWLIAAACGLVAVAVVFFAVSDHRRLRPNYALKRTCAE